MVFFENGGVWSWQKLGTFLQYKEVQKLMLSKKSIINVLLSQLNICKNNQEKMNDFWHPPLKKALIFVWIPEKSETMVLPKVSESGVTGEDTVAGPKISKLKEPVVGKFLIVMGKQKNSS